METAEKEAPLPVGWVQVQDGDGKLYISALDKVAVTTNPSGLPEGWIARAHKTLGLVFAHAQSLLDGCGRWTVIDPRGVCSFECFLRLKEGTSTSVCDALVRRIGLTPTGVVLHATEAGPVFVDEETGSRSTLDPRWNCQTTPSERRTFVRFEVTMNTGPSARRETAERYALLEEMLRDADVMPDAALVAVMAGSSSKAVMPCSRYNTAGIAELAFDEETQDLLEQLSQQRESMTNPSVPELLKRQSSDDPLQPYEGFAAHLRVRTQGCVARLDCTAAGSLELPSQCVVFGYFRTHPSRDGLQFRLLAPVRGHVDATELFRFERVAKPADISNSPVAAVLTSVAADTARASVIHSFATYQPAEILPIFDVSATSKAVLTTTPSVHTILDSMSQAWTRLLSGLAPFQLEPSSIIDDAPLVASTILRDDGYETKQQHTRALELWDMLRRQYKVAALRMMRARVEEERNKTQQAVENYERRLADIIDDRMCKICWDAEIDITCVPCGHQCVCHGCADDIRQCPMCCSVIDDKLPTVFPPSYGQNTSLLTHQPLCVSHHPQGVRRSISSAAAAVHDLHCGAKLAHHQLFCKNGSALEQRLEQAQEVLLSSDVTVLLSSLSPEA